MIRKMTLRIVQASGVCERCGLDRDFSKAEGVFNLVGADLVCNGCGTSFKEDRIASVFLFDTYEGDRLFAHVFKREEIYVCPVCGLIGYNVDIYCPGLDVGSELASIEKIKTEK
jgi:hypothetical protein